MNKCKHPKHSNTKVLSEMWQHLMEDARQWGSISHTRFGGLLTRALTGEPTLQYALTTLLASKLSDSEVPQSHIKATLLDVSNQFPDIVDSCAEDLSACVERDPACHSPCMAFMFFKGFHAAQTYRFAHALWQMKDKMSASWLQSRASTLFGVDIHPAAVIGDGLFIDHATGIVIGETAVVGNHVSLLHGVTLGGTGKEAGDRHPKVGDRVIISANATILGNIRIGEGARIGACSVVLKDVPSFSTVVGNPATLLPHSTSRNASRRTRECVT